MSPRKKQTNNAKRTEATDMDSVVNILNDVDQFIEGIYRDFSIGPTPEQPQPVSSSRATKQSLAERSNSTTKQALPGNGNSIPKQSMAVSSTADVVMAESIETSVQPSTSSSTRTKQTAKPKETAATCDLESVDDLLANVDQFIEGVYRDMSVQSKATKSFNMKPINFKAPTSNSLPVTSSVAAVTTATASNGRGRERNREKGATISNSMTVASSVASVTSSATASNGRGRERNRENGVSSNRPATSMPVLAECTCEKADRNHSPNKGSGAKRSHSATSSSATVTRPPVSTSAQQTSRQHVGGGGSGRQNRQRPTPAPSQFIDLSEYETQPRANVQRPSQNEEDVLLVEANINPVINMGQTSSRAPAPPPQPIRRQAANGMSVQFSGRGMNQSSGEVVSVVLGPTLAQRRRIEIRFNYNPIQTTYNVPQTCNVPQTYNMPQTSNAPQTYNMPQTYNVPQTYNMSQTSNMPQSSNMPQTCNIPQTFSVPQTSNMPQTSNRPQTYNMPQTYNIPQLNTAVPSNNPIPSTNPTTQTTTTAQSSAAATVQTPNNTAASTGSQDPPFMCAVCMESSLQRQPTSTRCGHIFCNECISHAIRLTHKCPLCNTKITANQIFRIYL